MEVTSTIQESINAFDKRTIKQSLKFESAKKFAEFVLQKPFFKYNKGGKVEVYLGSIYYSIFNPDLVFSIEDVNLSEFVEGILGVIHRWKNIDWGMKVEGDEDDPVFIYTPKEKLENFDLKFRVKEGKFKSCIVRKTIKRTTTNTYTDHEYDYEMECF